MNAFIKVKPPATMLLPLLWTWCAISCTGCDFEIPAPGEITVRYSLTGAVDHSFQHPLRYEVIWMGSDVYEVTDSGTVPLSPAPFAIHFSLPSKHVLERARSVETLMYNSHSLPETAVHRPRVVVFEDLNDNEQFNLYTDRIVALDGLDGGYDNYAAIAAILDLNGFLSQLTVDQHDIYYDWTGDKYTPFLYASTARFWNAQLFPLFETASVETEDIGDPSPILTLPSTAELLMTTHFACFREMHHNSTGIRVRTLVDDRLDVAALCANSDIPCEGYDDATAPDPDAMAAECDVISTSCVWYNGIEILAVHQGYVSCENCDCTSEYYTTTYFIDGDTLPPILDCPESPFLPSSPY